SGVDPLPALREAAFARFAELGLPTTESEDWKYTSLAALAQMRLEPAEAKADIDEELLRGLWSPPAEGSIQVVFVDGHHRPELSSPAWGSGGSFVGSLRAGLARNRDLVACELARHADFRRDALTALNTAFIEDGAFIHLPAGAVLQSPIHLLFLSTVSRGATLSHPRNLIVAGRGSQATVVETYAGPSEAIYFTNAVTEVVLDEGAHLDHYKLQQESERAFHIALLQVSHGRDSRFTSHSLALGAALARNDVRALFAAEGSECTLNGLYMATGKQQLEIFADDVKCAHGAAVGELDEDALFYLRSRGLGREAARSLLTYAFASEMVNLIPLAPLRARVRELVTSRLSDRESLREVA